MKALSLRLLTQDTANAILESVISKSSQETSANFFHVVEHAGYGAILSRLMTGFNRSLEFGANYSFRIDSPYSIETLFDIPFNKFYTDKQSDKQIIEWDFFKETWNASPPVRANHQFPRCPINIDGPPLSRHQWCAVLAKAICGKPLPELQAVIDSTKSSLGWSKYDIVIGLHVRRGDKNTEVPYIRTETYIHFLQKICVQHPDNKIAIFLTSDDPDCYEEFNENLKGKKNISILWDTKEDRFNNYNAGMVEESTDLAKQESITAAKNISLLGDCDYVIGMASAQFSWIGGVLCAFNHGLDTSRHIMIDATSNLQSHWACTYGFKAKDLVLNLANPRSLKVLHISPDESGGGAAKAAYRLHQSVQKYINSEMLVLRKHTNDRTVKSLRDGIFGKLRSKFYKKINRTKNQIDPRFHTNNPTLHSFGSSGYGLANQINQFDADIIHLHWIAGMLSIEDIAKINKPIIWTMHDMWAICGGEHYVPDDLPSSRFRVGYLDNNRPAYESGPDLNKQTWNAKLHAWKNKHFSIVGCSTWLAKCAKDSPLFKKSWIYAINFPLNLNDIWRPYPKDVSRDIFKLPRNKKLMLAGAVGGVNNFYKGGDLLKEALNYLSDVAKADFEIILFGQEAHEQFQDWPLPVHNVGKISDQNLLAQLYSCADVVIMPSRQEAFGQIASEAQACGVPVVAFQIGGPLDIVEHRQTGWLSPAYDTKDLAKGIEWILTNPASQEISKASRDRAMKLFSEEVIGQQYIDVYQQTLLSQT
ncbi:glycosyltransferase [Polynucleobacter paneuropaeus]|jgi:glycosyltransferase involved in cell wall biosynthesis|nr:glycosyltransferase [Polynucleobacter paneuropaeus]